MSEGRGPAEKPVREGNGRTPEAFADAERPVGEDIILKTGSREDAVSAEAGPKQPPVPDETNQDRRVARTTNRDGRYRGWLPGTERLTLGEFFAGSFTVGAVCLVLSAALAFAEGWTLLPTLLAENETLSSALGGIIVGLYVSIRLSSSRLARRKHLRGER